MHITEMWDPHLLCSFGFQWFHISECYLRVHSFSAPHAVSCPESTGLLPAVVALGVVLFIVILLLAVAIFIAILFYTRESLHTT